MNVEVRIRFLWDRWQDATLPLDASRVPDEIAVRKPGEAWQAYTVPTHGPQRERWLREYTA